MQNFVLGLDIGIASIGWSVIDMDHDKLIDLGVRVFEQAKPASESRKNRSSRRTIRRRVWRKKQLKKAFIDFGLLTKEELKQNDYMSYTTNTDSIKRPAFDTIYHLRKHALHEKVSIRELLLALYNICGTRGHFLMETVDFESTDGVSYFLFEEKFFDVCSDLVEFNNNIEEFKGILKSIFSSEKIKKTELTSLLKVEYGKNEKDNTVLKNILYLLCGFKVDLSKISEQVTLPDSKGTEDIISLQKKDELNPFLNSILELHDMIMISQILNQYSYICELAVDKLNYVKDICKLEKTNPTQFKDEVKKIQSKMNVQHMGNKLRVIKNIENKFPNGLYVKEARAILRQQQKYYPDKITDEFIEVCISIIKARIPYYIGPLSENAKNTWLVKKGNFTYSYEYSKEKCVDEYSTIKNWKMAMISHCTYLPKEFALPKGSFVAETFSILNELNILHATDKNENTYYLTQNDKIKIFDELFLKQKNITYKDISTLLNLKSYGPRRQNNNQKFKTQYTLYPLIQSYLPELKLNSILEIFENADKIKQIEDIILHINLFDEDISKFNYFKNDMKFSEKTAKQLSKLKSNNFYAFSKKFIMETPMNMQGQSLLELLFDNNTADYTNEQMTLISQATDENGNPVHFDSNKYLEKLTKNKHLTIDLLIDKGKPFIPISRSVIRSLNECFKLYEEIIRTYGIPNRVVIETARDLKDSSRQGEVPAKHFDQMKNCHKYLTEQLKQKDNKLYKHNLEDWDKVSSYLNINRKKVELYIRQLGLDMISGDPIDLDNLQNYEIDHILPRGFGDNSMDNLMLINKTYNAAKQNRVPLEYLENEHVTDKKGNMITTSSFMNRVQELFKLGMISEKKVKQLSLSSSEEAMGFINRNLVDTRYIIKELIAILKAYNMANKFNTHIVALKASFTSIYREALGFQKNRDIGDQHHAHDAAIVSIADKLLSTYYPNYDERGNNQAYKEFIKKIMNTTENQNKSEKYKLNFFILKAYENAFHNYPTDFGSLVSQVKARVPLYSVKVEKNYKGEFYKATILKPTDVKKNNPLSILKVNNELHAFTSVYCAAVDFYKYTDKKGNRKHVAVHIPRLIVDNDGNINKEKYISLILNYYKVPELLDENRNIKEYYFKLRVFKNDLIYDTNNYVIQKFNIGSIAKKLLEMKHLYVFSFNQIYNQVSFMRKALSIHFDFKLKHINPNGSKKFSDYDIHEIISFCIDNLMKINNKDKYEEYIINHLKKETNLQSFLEKAAYFNLIVNRNCTPPTITGQYTPSADGSSITNDTQYIKIKSSVLGIRYFYNEKGKLMILGPNGAEEKFSKIKKEKFSWKICKTVLE